MRSFLGAANFFHTHIPNYAEWASSLYECTTTSFNWTPSTWVKDYKTIFEVVKSSIQTAVTLHFPDYNLPWVIRSDASDHAVGAVLFQIYSDSNGAVHQSGAAVNWDTFKQEAYALYYPVVQFNYYLHGKSFVIEIDHRNLVWMESSQVPIVVRWRVLLQSFIFEVRHIPGKDNIVADWLSRMYPPSIGLPSLNSLAATDLPNLLEMFHSVHGHRSLYHGAKKTYLAMCTRYPGHGVPMRIIQDLVVECPLCQKDRIPHTTIPHPTSIQTLLHHTRSIGIDHVTMTPHDEDGYVGLLHVVEHDTKYPDANHTRSRRRMSTVPERSYTSHNYTAPNFYPDPSTSHPFYWH